MLLCEWIENIISVIPLVESKIPTKEKSVTRLNNLYASRKYLFCEIYNLQRYITIDISIKADIFIFRRIIPIETFLFPEQSGDRKARVLKEMFVDKIRIRD